MRMFAWSGRLMKWTSCLPALFQAVLTAVLYPVLAIPLGLLAGASVVPASVAIEALATLRQHGKV